MSASGLSCPSDTGESCYKYESSTVSSGGCSKTCTYKVANTPKCGANAEKTGSGTSCSCKCKDGYYGDPFTECKPNCTPLANESSDSNTCKTTSYSCDNGCGGTRTCYKSACTGSQVCYNKSCCTPKWPSYQGYDYNNCMTSSDGTVSDGCGGTATKYKSACTGNKTCNGSGQCVENVCTPNCIGSSKPTDELVCSPGESKRAVSNDGCGGTCSICECQKTNCSGYPYGGNTPYTIYTGYGHYDTCEPGCGESTRYKCKSGYTAKLMSGTTYYCAQDGGGTGGGSGGSCSCSATATCSGYTYSCTGSGCSYKNRTITISGYGCSCNKTNYAYSSPNYPEATTGGSVTVSVSALAGGGGWTPIYSGYHRPVNCPQSCSCTGSVSASITN